MARPSWLPSYWLLLLGAAGALAVLAEIVLRVLGFGDPPLYNLDPDIEYYARAGDYRRYGNQVHVNSVGMRSAEVRPRGRQLRVLLLGDSIVFGTYRVAQDELISIFVAEQLQRLGVRDVEVLNAACSSWGPENQLAYLKRFGTFDADWAVWVLSSHDADDVPVPGYAELLPREKPWLALQEVLGLLRAKRFHGARPSDPRARTLLSVDRIVDLFRERRIPLMVAQHLSSDELAHGLGPGGLALSRRIEALGVPLLSLETALATAQKRSEAPYQDALHVSPVGARVIGVAIANELHMNMAKASRRDGASQR